MIHVSPVGATCEDISFYFKDNFCIILLNLPENKFPFINIINIIFLSQLVPLEIFRPLVLGIRKSIKNPNLCFKKGINLLQILIFCGNPACRGRCSVYFSLVPSPHAALLGGGESDDVGSGVGGLTTGEERTGSFWKPTQVIMLYFDVMRKMC